MPTLIAVSHHTLAQTMIEKYLMEQVLAMVMAGGHHEGKPVLALSCVSESSVLELPNCDIT